MRADFPPCSPAEWEDMLCHFDQVKILWGKYSALRKLGWTADSQAAWISLFKLLLPYSYCFVVVFRREAVWFICSSQPDQGNYLEYLLYSTACVLGHDVCCNRDLWTEFWGSPVIWFLKMTHTWMTFKKQTNKQIEKPFPWFCLNSASQRLQDIWKSQQHMRKQSWEGTEISSERSFTFSNLQFSSCVNN